MKLEGTGLLDFRYLNAFVQTVRSGNFSAAAQRLGVTPAAVSKWIAALEKQLDTRLFHRSSRRLSLTTEGELLLDKVSTSLSHLDEAVELLHEARREPSGLIRLSVMPGVARHLVIPLLPGFLAEHPKVSVEINLNDGTVDPIRENFDIEIRRGRRPERTYIARLLCPFPIVAVASPDYLARRGTPLTPDDLCGHDCIGTRMSNGDFVSWEFVAAATDKQHRSEQTWMHIPLGRFAVSGQIDANLRGAMMGLGIAIMPAATAAPFLKTGALQAVLSGYRWAQEEDIYLHYAHRDHLALKTRVLADYLHEHLRDGKVPPDDWMVAANMRQRSSD